MSCATGSILIRAVHIDDALRLRELRLDALRNHPAEFGADLVESEARAMKWWVDLAHRNDGSGREVIFLALDREELVGMAGVWSNAAAKTRHRAGVWGVYVRASYRGRGVGERMVRAAVDWARAKGFALLTIDVVVGNDVARRCYERCGFATYGIQPMVVRVNGVFYDEHLMWRRL